MRMQLLRKSFQQQYDVIIYYLQYYQHRNRL